MSNGVNDHDSAFAPVSPNTTHSKHVTLYTRRQMLGLMACSAVGAVLPRPTGSFGPPEKRNASLVLALKRQLEEAFAGNDIGFCFAYLSRDPEQSFEITIQPDRVYPVASAFKAAVALYYFMNTPPSEWYYTEGSDMYSMAVYSNNLTTARVMHEVAKRLNQRNPIQAFNDFAQDRRMAGLQFGLYQWTFEEFPSPTNGYIDPRCDPAPYAAKSMSKTAVNYSSAADLARLYYFLMRAEQDPRWGRDAHFRAAIEATREVLGIPAPNYTSPLERVIAYIPHFSKDGVLQAGEIDAHVINDAGVWQMHDGGAYLISFMSANVSPPRIDTALGHVAEAIRTYQRYLYPNQYHLITAPSHPVHHGELDYGFVRKTGVALYSAPDLAAPPVENPVRPTSIFGTTYLMYGALVRVKVIDAEWAQIERDDRWDKAFDWPVYIRLEDVQIIDRDPAQPLGYITGQGDVGKLAVLDIYRRELSLFEGRTAVLRTPVILNTQNTPRDIGVMERAYLTRNMPNYPGVPFTTFLHGTPYLDAGGFAVHGSPWHLWEETVRQSTLLQRVTHGCINVPDWRISIPYLGREMRTDEFVFRWSGGFAGPENQFVYAHAQPVRVYNVNNVERELSGYPLPDAYRKGGVYWRDILNALHEKTLDAPDIFYSENA